MKTPKSSSQAAEEELRAQLEKEKVPLGDPQKKASKTTIVVAGGVAANQYLRSSLKQLEQNHGCEFFFPSIKLCTDNGAMIALAGLERYERKLFNKLTFKPKPRWTLDKKAIFKKGKRAVGI